MMNIAIRTTTEDDISPVDKLHRRAFGESGGKIVALLQLLRRTPSTLVPIELVAVEEDQVIGHVCLSAARLDAPRQLVDVLTLSPLGVLPSYQGRGVGTRLITEGLAEAGRRYVPLVFLEGHPGFYGARGFRNAGELGFRRPSLRIPDVAFQVALLAGYEPWMTGSFVYSDPFWAEDCVGLR